MAELESGQKPGNHGRTAYTQVSMTNFDPKAPEILFESQMRECERTQKRPFSMCSASRVQYDPKVQSRHLALTLNLHRIHHEHRS